MLKQKIQAQSFFICSESIFGKLYLIIRYMQTDLNKTWSQLANVAVQIQLYSYSHTYSQIQPVRYRYSQNRYSQVTNTIKLQLSITSLLFKQLCNVEMRDNCAQYGLRNNFLLLTSCLNKLQTYDSHIAKNDTTFDLQRSSVLLRSVSTIVIRTENG